MGQHCHVAMMVLCHYHYVHTLNALFTKQDNALIDIVLVHTELHTLVFLHVCVHTANCPGYPNDTMAVSVTAETVRPAA